MCILETCFLIRMLVSTCLSQIPKCKSHHTHLTKREEFPGGTHFENEKTRSCECWGYKAQLTVSWLARHTSIFIVPPGLLSLHGAEPRVAVDMRWSSCSPQTSPTCLCWSWKELRLSKELSLCHTFIIGKTLRAERQGHRYDSLTVSPGAFPSAP